MCVPRLFLGLLVLHTHPLVAATAAATAAGAVTEGIPHLVEVEATVVEAEAVEDVN